MTSYTSGGMNHADHHSSAENPTIDEALGWEGHVNLPPSPALANLLRNWSEVQTGLTFGMVFVVGVLVGGVLFSALGSGKKNSDT